MKFRFEGIFLFVNLLFVVCGCSLDQMQSESKIRPFQNSSLFPDGTSARLPISGTVARGHLNEDELLYRGIDNGKLANVFPFQITHSDLELGRERFNTNCSPCHGQTGLGNGMVVQRGYTTPPSFFIDRLKNAPHGHFVQVILNGYGAMPSYREQVTAPDRWRIAAYIRALQLSRSLSLKDLPPDVSQKIEGSSP